MIFDGECYREAAIERIDDAHALYRAQHYGLSVYTSGLAVECIFRAYRMLVNPAFDSRHDLFELHRALKIQTLLNEEDGARIKAALSMINRLWTNDLRFVSQRSLLQSMKRGGHDRGIRGDALKELARRAYNAGEVIVGIGVRKWTDSPRN